MELTDIVTKIKDAHPNIGFINMFGMEDTYTFLIHFRYDDEEYIEEEEEDEYEEDEEYELNEQEKEEQKKEDEIYEKEYKPHRESMNYRHMFIHQLCITSDDIEIQVGQLVEKCKKLCIKTSNDKEANP